MKYLSVLAFFNLILITTALKAAPVEVNVKMSPAGSFMIKSDKIDGTVTVSGSTVKATNINIPAQSLKTGIQLRDKHMLERLEADKFPMITLLLGEGANGLGTGTIKIKGIEKPIAGTYNVTNNLISAQFKLKLSDFAIEKIRYLAVGVKDEVEVTVQIPATK